MSRISQEVASQMATKLTEKSKVAADVLRKGYAALVRSYYIKQIPAEVIATYKKYPQWFSTSESVTFHGNGFRYENVDIDDSVICNGERDGDANLNLTAKIAGDLMKSKRKWEKAQEGYMNLKRETKVALINLGTFKRIEESIPEAKDLIPPPMSNALVVNVDSLNKKLSNQPTIDSAKEKSNA